MVDTRRHLDEARAALAESRRGSTRPRLATPEAPPPIDLVDEEPREVDPQVAAVLAEIAALKAENRRLRDDLARVGRIVGRALDT